MSELPKTEQSVESHVTMQTELAWELLKAARVRCALGRISVKNVAVMDAASDIFQAHSLDRTIIFPKSLESVLIELACQDAPTQENNIIPLNQVESARPIVENVYSLTA